MRPTYQYLSPNNHTTKRQTRLHDPNRSPEMKTHLNSPIVPINIHPNNPNPHQSKLNAETPKSKPAFLEKRVNHLPPKQTQYQPRAQMVTNINDQTQLHTPDLRITCPNVFNKVELSALRNTTHGNKLPKYSDADEGREGKRSDIVHDSNRDNRDMKKKGTSELIYSYTDIKRPNLSRTNITPVKEAQNSFQKTCGPKTLSEIWSKNKELINLKKEELSTELDESCELDSNKLDSSKIIQGFYKLKQLGVGKFGEVYLAKHIKTGFLVALKKIEKKKINQYKMVNQFKEQIRLHNSLDHPNIVKFYGFFEENNCIYLIIEYIQGGTLFDALNENDRLSPMDAAHYVKCTLEAITYMHDKSIAHRDIKPENIVIASDGVSKLCDFGWSALVESSRKTYCGTFDYVPPQVLEQKNYDTSVDIWCIGVLAYQLLTGRVPFQGQKKKEIMDKIISVDKRKISFPVDVGAEAKDFIEQIVQKDPKLRPKCRDLLKHPFIVNNTRQNKK